MEVIIVHDFDPSAPRAGGMARYSGMLLNYLAKAGIKTTLLGTRRTHTNEQSNNDFFTLVPIVKKEKFTGYEYILKLAMKTPTLDIPKSAIIHAQHPAYMLPFVIFHRKNPKILTIHGQLLDNIRLKRNRLVQFVYHKIETIALKHSDIIIVVDEGTGKSYRQQYPSMVEPILIPTGIDLTKFKLLDRSILRPKYGLTSKDKVIAYVGRLEKEKGVDFLLDCFSSLTELIPMASLIIIGDGRDREYLENMVADLGLKRVRFLGMQEPGIIPEILNCADVMVLCSLYEGSPTVVKEALACGVPVISTDVGDVRQILKDPVIGLVLPRKKEDFVKALTGILSRDDSEYVRNRCAASAAVFGFDNIGTRIVELYKELAS